MNFATIHAEAILVEIIQKFLQWSVWNRDQVEPWSSWNQGRVGTMVWLEPWSGWNHALENHGLVETVVWLKPWSGWNQGRVGTIVWLEPWSR